MMLGLGAPIFLGFAHWRAPIPHILFGFHRSTVYIFPGFG